MQPRFHRANGNIKRLGDILIRDVLKIPQQNDLRVVAVQAVQRLLNALLDFLLLRAVLRISAAVNQHQIVVQRNLSLSFAVQAFAPAAGMVKSDPIEPSGKAGVATKLLNRFVSREEHFLRRLARFIIVSQEPINQVESRILVPPHQYLEGFGVAPLNALDAFRVTYFLSEHGILFVLDGPVEKRFPLA